MYFSFDLNMFKRSQQPFFVYNFSCHKTVCSLRSWNTYLEYTDSAKLFGAAKVCIFLISFYSRFFEFFLKICDQLTHLGLLDDEHDRQSRLKLLVNRLKFHRKKRWKILAGIVGSCPSFMTESEPTMNWNDIVIQDEVQKNLTRDKREDCFCSWPKFVMEPERISHFEDK